MSEPNQRLAAPQIKNKTGRANEMLDTLRQSADPPAHLTSRDDLPTIPRWNSSLTPGKGDMGKMSPIRPEDKQIGRVWGKPGCPDVREQAR